MKLRLYKALHRIVRRAAAYLTNLEDELDWRIIYHTPVGPNPHLPGTLTHLLWEEGNRLRNDFRLRRTIIDKNPWTTLLNDPPTKWPEQMGETVTNTPQP